MKPANGVLSILVAGWMASTCPAPSQTDNQLHVFTNSPDGGDPVAGLVLAGNTLYGTTEKGGAATLGVVFAVNTDGSGYCVLHSFTGSLDGSHPLGGLVLGGDTLYGATENGGTNGWGTLFALNTNGDAAGYAELYNFNVYSNGVLPCARLTLAGGTIYGTASGQGYGKPGWGTIFSVSTNGGSYTALYNFSTPNGTPLANMDGEQPLSELTLSGGTLYGTTYGGGAYGCGTVYSVQSNGSNFMVLHTFTNNPDGAFVQGGLVLAGATLYGTTLRGGTNGNGTVFAVNPDGSGYWVLHHFATNGVDGLRPYATLTLCGNTLYGTTHGGGSSGHGTVFAVNTNGTGYRALYAFTGEPDGANPECDLTLSAGTLYGTTESGGSSAWGTVFGLAVPVLSITDITLAGTNLILNAANGVVGETYLVLTSSNLASPFNQWTPVATNVPAANGSFMLIATNAVRAAAPQQFYRLEAQ